MVIAGPLALAMAHKLGVNPDTFLMGVTVASSCAFLTPIGHQNNTLIMGPGGYAFTDYWHLGLALEAVVLLIGVPMILFVWPL
jgi:di/tricarboxylate transporter